MLALGKALTRMRSLMERVRSVLRLIMSYTRPGVPETTWTDTNTHKPKRLDQVVQ